MSSSQFLTDASTRHGMFVQRFANGEKKKLLKYVNRVQKIIASRLDNTRLTAFQGEKLTRELNDLRALTIETYKSMGKELTDDMIEFGKYEAEFSKTMFDKGIDATFSLPSTDQIEAAIKTRPMNISPGSKKGYTIGTSLRQFEKKAATEIIRTIKDGIIQGRTAAQIKRDVRQITGFVQTQNVEALVRTTSNHVSTQARIITMKENRDILKGYQVIATLDSRTTIICAGLDGKIFSLNSVQYPPYHWSCRSTLKPVLKAEYDLFSKVGGDRPAIGSKGVESVSTRVTFDTWLRGQPASFKKEYFSRQPQGAIKYKLFEEGGLKLDKYTDSKNATYSLAQLRAKQPLAFEKAGL